MLELGATSFWEEYDPRQEGDNHFEMYGRPFGKSLCHAWGASPLFLLGKYYLGVKPLEPGYAKFVIEPVLADLEWMEGKVPLPVGDAAVFMDGTTIRVEVPSKGGVLRFRSATRPEANAGVIESCGGGCYALQLEQPGFSYTIRYS